MILQALNQRYETLVEQGILSRPGWDDAFKVSYGLELGADGSLIALVDLRQEILKGKKTVIQPRQMRVPAHVGRTVGIAPNFLCDNVSYMFGADEKGRPKRAVECFQATQALHQQILRGVESPAAEAILAFFERWEPEKTPSHPLLETEWKNLCSNANLVFFFRDRAVTEDPAICQAWQNHYDQTEPGAVTGQCLITGGLAPIATTHPPIKGVRDAQSSGAALVSFNAPAFCSYGHEQNYNAPVGSQAAFGYTTALNRLLADSEHCKVIGDTTVVCWAEHGDPAYQDACMAMMYGETTGIDDADLSRFLYKVAKGDPLDWNEQPLSEDEHFYILGLSPNAARLSVRFFFQDTFGVLARNIQKHYQDISIDRPTYETYSVLPLWRLLNETVNQNAKTKKPVPQLAGDMLRAILNGTPYPSTLLLGAQLRIRAEHKITWGRAAILKGYYTRATTIPFPREVLTMNRNETSTDLAYTLGRMFSVYEQIQQAANPNINTTIKDKYFNGASSTPSVIFPLLGNLAQKHLRVIRRDKAGLAVILERHLGELSVIVGSKFPDRLSLPQQGAFQLGYYFENIERYKPRKEKNNATEKEESDHV